MSDDDAATHPNTGNSRLFEIIQCASDPNRQWHLITRDAAGNEQRRTGFRTYGDAWHAAERLKSGEDECQSDLLDAMAQQRPASSAEYRADILAWSSRQAALLRRLVAGEKIADQIDWESVIEEVEFAGRRQLLEIKSLLVQALASMLQIWAWPQSPEVPIWLTEAQGCQRNVAASITPNMRSRIDINELYFKAIRCVLKTSGGRETPLFPTECPISLDQVLGD